MRLGARSRGQTEDPLVHLTELMLPPLSARIGLLCCAAMVCLPTPSQGQIPSPQSGEYSICGAISGDQDFPALCLGASGGYVVWEDSRVDGNNGHGIVAARFGSDLTGTGAVFRVNQQIAGDQARPQALLLNGGA